MRYGKIPCLSKHKIYVIGAMSGSLSGIKVVYRNMNLLSIRAANVEIMRFLKTTLYFQTFKVHEVFTSSYKLS